MFVSDEDSGSWGNSGGGPVRLRL